MMDFERWKIGHLQWCDFKQEKDLMKLFSCQIVWYVMEELILVGVLGLLKAWVVESVTARTPPLLFF